MGEGGKRIKRKEEKQSKNPFLGFSATLAGTSELLTPNCLCFEHWGHLSCRLTTVSVQFCQDVTLSFRKQFHPFLPVWRGSDSGLGLILTRICWEVCASLLEIWSSSECSAGIISMVSALSAGASRGLLPSDTSSGPARPFPQYSLFNAHTRASFLELGLSWSILS